MRNTITIFAIFLLGNTGQAQNTYKFDIISQFDTIWVKKETFVKSGEKVRLPTNAYVYAIHKGTAELFKTNGQVDLFRAGENKSCLQTGIWKGEYIPVKYTDQTWKVNSPVKQITAIGGDVIFSWISLRKEKPTLVKKGNNHILYDRSTGSPVSLR